MKTALLFLLWIVVSVVLLCFNATFWLGLGSLAACIIVGRKYYEDGGSDAKGVC